VIELLNKYYVPVTSANEDMEPGGRAPQAERDERRRIYGDFLERKMGAGEVHVYVIGPDRRSLGGLDVGSAMDIDKEVAFLSALATQEHVQAGPPPFRPQPRSIPPHADSSSLAIHLTARKIEGGRTWNEFPSENWIMLTRQDWSQVLPPSGASLQTTWTMPPAVAMKLGEWVYPQTEETHRVNRSKVELADFRLTIVTLQGSLCRARIEGKVRLVHSFYPGHPAEDYASADLIGFADFDLGRGEVQRLRIVTQKAQYQGTQFACSLVSVSRETLEALQ
jgi:hypothetical protein